MLVLGSDLRASPVVQRLKRLPAIWETWVRSLGREDLLEKGMAIHSNPIHSNPLQRQSTPLWTEEPDEQQSMVSQRSDMTKQLTLSLGLGNIHRMFRTGTDTW